MSEDASTVCAKDRISWRIVTLDAANSESLSTAVTSCEEAIVWARDLIAKKTRVVRIQASDGQHLALDDIEAWTPKADRR